MVSQDYELEEEVLKVLTQFVGGTTSEVHEVYNTLKEKDNEQLNHNVSVEVDHKRSTLLDKTLGASLDPLDDLFCRWCLVFDCRLHGYSQTVITPTERHYHPPESQEDMKPCSDHCYLQTPFRQQRRCQLRKCAYRKGNDVA